MEKNLSKNILILEGGLNEEHEVSLSSAKEVKKALKELNYNYSSILVNPKDFQKKIFKYKNIDVCFNALHGPYGEDGTIQEVLEKTNLKYTHSGIKASKNAFNKNLTKIAIKKTKIKCLQSYQILKKDIKKNTLYEYFRTIGSFVLKPTSSGSSFGVKIFLTSKEIDFFFNNFDSEIKIYKNHNEFMIERFVIGRELTVAVYMQKGVSEPIEVTEIKSKNNFFDYQAKYSKGISQHFLPAEIPKNIYDECLKYAKIAHDTLDCIGITRSDFIYDEINNAIFFLEINTQPGLTPLSLVPEQLNYRNISFVSLIQELINTA